MPPSLQPSAPRHTESDSAQSGRMHTAQALTAKAYQVCYQGCTTMKGEHLSTYIQLSRTLANSSRFCCMLCMRCYPGIQHVESNMLHNKQPSTMHMIHLSTFSLSTSFHCGDMSSSSPPFSSVIDINTMTHWGSFNQSIIVTTITPLVHCTRQEPAVHSVLKGDWTSHSCVEVTSGMYDYSK